MTEWRKRTNPGGTFDRGQFAGAQVPPGTLRRRGRLALPHGDGSRACYQTADRRISRGHLASVADRQQETAVIVPDVPGVDTAPSPPPPLPSALPLPAEHTEVRTAATIKPDPAAAAISSEKRAVLAALIPQALKGQEELVSKRAGGCSLATTASRVPGSYST
jgi:hypothetical protein